jgi:hypothetical protein
MDVYKGVRNEKKTVYIVGVGVPLSVRLHGKSMFQKTSADMPA